MLHSFQETKFDLLLLLLLLQPTHMKFKQQQQKQQNNTVQVWKWNQREINRISVTYIYMGQRFKITTSEMCGRQPLKIWSDMVCLADHITSNFLKVVFQKIYLVHYWTLCPIHAYKPRTYMLQFVEVLRLVTNEP